MSEKVDKVSNIVVKYVYALGTSAERVKADEPDRVSGRGRNSAELNY